MMGLYREKGTLGCTHHTRGSFCWRRRRCWRGGRVWNAGKWELDPSCRGYRVLKCHTFVIFNLFKYNIGFNRGLLNYQKDLSSHHSSFILSFECMFNFSSKYGKKWLFFEIYRLINILRNDNAYYLWISEKFLRIFIMYEISTKLFLFLFFFWKNKTGTSKTSSECIQNSIIRRI